MTRKPETTRSNQGRYLPGKSGNVDGRPRGSFNRSTMVMQAMFEGEAEEIGRVCIERALAGDPVALRLVVERLLSPVRDRTVNVTMPVLTTVADLPPAVSALLQQVAAGEITPSEGERIAALLSVWRQATELVDLEQRIAAIEQAQR